MLPRFSEGRMIQINSQWHCMQSYEPELELAQRYMREGPPWIFGGKKEKYFVFA